MEQYSKETATRIDNGRTVITSVEVHGTEAAAVLDRMLGGREGFKPGQSQALLKALASTLSEQNAALIASEEQLTAESADDVRARQDLDTASTEASSAAIKAKSLISEVLGREALRLYGLAGETPTGPKDLHRYLCNAVTLLQQNPREVNDDMLGTVSTAAIAKRLAASAATLDKAIATHARESRETQLALVKRDESRATWVETYRAVATTLAGLYRLAGKPDLADRIRQTARKAVGKEGPDTTPDDPATPTTPATPAAPTTTPAKPSSDA